MTKHLLILALVACTLLARPNTHAQQNQQHMKVAVWDTYVKNQNGDVLHFDIIVPEAVKDTNDIFRFGKEYLHGIGEPDGLLTTSECQFCHIETPTAEMLGDIRNKGYYILEMETIPAALPATPSRRDLILHIRAQFPQYRFTNFRNTSEEALCNIISTRQQ